ncbi:magnesium transporter [Lentinula aff. detonsa]|uniref:Magnesium transporter n=1 Tax=Lentinula aff. detonsa TaxID=2804958 RepID=A0AA38KZ45_9AGAR|nr:magnesium transporter [Lentinula aff. detonsa]KAJ3797427.1 magnesium transporter [Lentinula aff. detonsa]
MLGRLFLLVATLFILHAAFSTYDHLSHLKSIGKPEGALPYDIILEAVIGLAMGILGASLNAAPLKEITWSSEMKTRSIDEMDARLGFANYINRGRKFLS